MATRAAVDQGGTFIGLAAYDADAGRIPCCESPTTPARPLDSAIAYVDQAGIDLGESALFGDDANNVARDGRGARGGGRHSVVCASRSSSAAVRTGGPVTILPAGARAARPAPCRVGPPIRKPRRSAVGRLLGMIDASRRATRPLRPKGLMLESI